jgi:YhgE/Pip-like protein
VLPILVMSLLIWAFWSPGTNHGAAKAAVVNNDRAVTVNGQTPPLGRELAGNLTHSESAYSWVLTDADDARNGLARGDYGAVVTIPENFSAKATSSASSNPMEAGQAELRVQTSNATGVADPLISTQIAQIVLRTLNQQIVQTYLENVYLSFSTIHDQLDRAADGATQLADGADKLKTGAAQLSSGSRQLASDSVQQIAKHRRSQRHYSSCPHRHPDRSVARRARSNNSHPGSARPPPEPINCTMAPSSSNAESANSPTAPANSPASSRRDATKSPSTTRCSATVSKASPPPRPLPSPTTPMSAPL